jgi:hypothetical protein
MTDEKKSGIPPLVGQIVGGIAGTYIGYVGSEKLADLAINELNLGISPEFEGAAETALCIGAGLATGYAAVTMAKKDPNLALFHGARIAASIGAVNLAIEMKDNFDKLSAQVDGIHEKLVGLEHGQSDHILPSNHDAAQHLAATDFTEATAGGFGTEGPNGGPSNDPERAFGAFGASDLGSDMSRVQEASSEDFGSGYITGSQPTLDV